MRLDQLLKVGAEAARNGNRPAARSLFLALARENPDDVRVWVGLAGVAASRNEQREALERVVALDPSHERARLALARLNAAAAMQPASPRHTPVLAETMDAAASSGVPWSAPAEVEPAHEQQADEEPERAAFPLLNAIALGLILLLLAALGLILGRALLGGTDDATAPAATAASDLQPTAALGRPVSTTAATAGGEIGAVPTVSLSVPSPTPELPSPAAATAPVQVATPSLEQEQSLLLPMGTPIDYDGWTAVLVRPDDAVPLDGAIGDLQPNGRFVLAVVAVSNNSATPRVIPPDLFLLLDSSGRSYSPVPGASTTYLALYERAQRGDLALEDSFEPVLGLRSVPLIFDVAPDASGLRLTVNGAGPAGWPVGEGAPAPAPSGP
jgi:hypothetical protein